jgi:hypothetical protein
MKRVIAIALFLNAVLLTGILLNKEVIVHAVGERGGVPIGNGDVNGDGNIDLGDAVYSLNWLFRGGPAPVAIECPQPAGKGLPATAQTLCYNQTITEIPCKNAACPGQDGFYQAGCPSEGRFVDNGDGTLNDTCTGLMWQKDTAYVNGDGQTPLDNSDALTWCDALVFCENLSFAGHDDWRLPNVRELQSIVDYKYVAPSIDPVFGALGGALNWSSTTYAT